jgi:uncharacterized protein YbjQ (UPF0145 family)
MSFNDGMKDDVKSLTKHIKIPGRSCIHLEFRYCSGVGLLLYTVARYKLPITSIAMIGSDADDLEYDLNGLEVFIHGALKITFPRVRVSFRLHDSKRRTRLKIDQPHIMWNQTSHQSGTLPGPSSQLSSNIVLPRSPAKKRVFGVTVPPGKSNGDTLKIKVDGKPRIVTVPSIAETNFRRPIRPGEKFDYELFSNLDHIYVSTLPFVPGLEIMQSKPIIFGSVAQSLLSQSNENDRLKKDFTAVHDVLVRQAHVVGANAVLSVQFQTNTDHERIYLTAVGTPCLVGPSVLATATESFLHHCNEATSNNIMPATHASAPDWEHDIIVTTVDAVVVNE